MFPSPFYPRFEDLPTKLSLLNENALQQAFRPVLYLSMFFSCGPAIPSKVAVVFVLHLGRVSCFCVFSPVR